MSKEHAYAYEAGYRDGSIHYELKHCPACKNVADLQEALAENANLREELEAAKHDLQVFSANLVRLEAENAKLREQMERLVTLLRVDCDIDASWDGLRRFWSIGLTEDGCLMRDRACKAEAENAKLRELLAKAGKLLPLADWTNVRYDEMASEVMYGIDELGVEVNDG